MMDKYDRLLDAIEHPGKYSDEELKEMLSDPELRRAYRLMAATRSFMAEKPEPDVDSEWQRFSARHLQPRRPLVVRLFGGRPVAAAAVAAIVSLAAVAAGITISVRSSAPDAGSAGEVYSDYPVAGAIAATDTVADVAPADSAIVSAVTFKDEPLSVILGEIGRHYGAEVVFKNPDTGRLRLYYNWNSSMTLDAIVDQLNNFEQINIDLSGKKIIVN